MPTTFVLDLICLLVLLAIGLLTLFLIVKLVFLILPGAIVAGSVWFLTKSGFWAGVAFLIVIVLGWHIGLLRNIRRRRLS